jgi:hypothetical protein
MNDRRGIVQAMSRCGGGGAYLKQGMEPDPNQMKKAKAEDLSKMAAAGSQNAKKKLEKKLK